MKKFILIILTLFSFGSIKADHAIGGNISVRWLSANNYELNVTFFFNCNSSSNPIPSDVEVAVYDKGTHAEYTREIILATTVDSMILGDACFTPDLCVKQYTYTKNIVLPDNANGYYISTYYFARTAGMINIPSAGKGMTFYTEIPNPDPGVNGTNSSPVMGAYPSNSYLCVDLDNTIQLNVTDPDGDSLVYSFATPYGSPGIANGSVSGPYTEISWNPGYSLADVVGGTPPMTINDSTGEIIASPLIIGLYAVVIKVEEFRDGVKIGEIRRDFQFSALKCLLEDPPQSLRNEADTTIQLVSGNDFCYSLIYQDPNSLTDTVYLNVSSPVFEGVPVITEPTPFTTSPDSVLYEYDGTSIITPKNNYSTSLNAYYNNTGEIGLRFCWTPSCKDIATSPIPITVTASSYNCDRESKSVMNFNLDIVRPESHTGVIPNVFTPNDDEFNDIYELGGFYNPCPDEMSVEIYNRWGIKMFESTDLDFGWDGKNMDGKEAPSGTYYIIITGSFEKEVILEQRRVITLLR